MKGSIHVPNGSFIVITIVDYGLGNNGSILNMLRKIGCRNVRVSSDPRDIVSATKLILPGVGHFDRGMTNLCRYGLIDPLREQVLNANIPILGICLGMQMLAERSEEGTKDGLRFIRGEVVRFRLNGDRSLKVPHMGWDYVSFTKRSALAIGLEGDARFYFVHSYHMVCENPDDILGMTEYGYQFVSAVACEHILGVQFHPEKSHKFGMTLLRNFVEQA
jgi:glutamine amidotransferase